MEIEEKKVSTVKVEMPIAYTSTQLKTQPVQTSLEDGMATTLDVDSKDVSVREVTRRTRRLEGCEGSSEEGCDGDCLWDNGANKCVDFSKVEFEVVSKEAGTGALDTMKANIEEAAKEGSLIAHIKSAAIDNGALTKGMQDMQDQVAVTTTTATKTIEVAVVKPASNLSPTKVPITLPSSSPTPTPTTASGGGGGITDAEIAGAASGAIVGLVVISAVVWVFFKPSAPQPNARQPKQAHDPVHFDTVESNLRFGM